MFRNKTNTKSRKSLNRNNNVYESLEARQLLAGMVDAVDVPVVDSGTEIVATSASVTGAVEPTVFSGDLTATVVEDSVPEITGTAIATDQDGQPIEFTPVPF